jgi:hypothetical protein
MIKNKGNNICKVKDMVVITKEGKNQEGKTFEEHCKTQKMNKCIKRPIKGVILKCAHTRKEDR